MLRETLTITAWIAFSGFMAYLESRMTYLTAFLAFLGLCGLITIIGCRRALNRYSAARQRVTLPPGFMARYKGGSK